MIFLYFILICIVLGLISYFIIMPLSEKDFIKKIVDNIINICLSIFIIYSFIAVIITTTDLINKWLHINEGWVLALPVVLVFLYGLIKKYIDK